MKHTGPIVMYHLGNTVNTLKAFNAAHVVRFWAEWDKPSTRAYRRSLINTFPINNFFRKLFGLPVKKPWRPKHFFEQPSLRIEFVNDYHPRRYIYTSKAAMMRDLDDLSKFMYGYGKDQ